jgi:hypothetical protein
MPYSKLAEIEQLRKRLQTLAVHYRISKWGQHCLLCEDRCDRGKTLYHAPDCLLNKARQKKLREQWKEE